MTNEPKPPINLFYCLIIIIAGMVMLAGYLINLI